MFPSVLVTEGFGRKGSEHSRPCPVLRGTKRHHRESSERHQEPPQSSESSCKGNHDLQESPSEETSAWNFSSKAGMTAREHGIITKAP